MSITKEQIRALLKSNQYERYAVENIITFQDCIALNQDGVKAVQRFYEWEAGDKPPPIGNLSPQYLTSKTLMFHANMMNGIPNLQKSAECSKFAKLAIGELLKNPAITDNYNVVMAGIMGNKHSIGILVPIKYEFTAQHPKIKAGKLPPDSLIIDPWARALGHPVEMSLAVETEHYVFNEQLAGMSIHYQSKHDDTLEASQKSASVQGNAIHLSLLVKNPDEELEAKERRYRIAQEKREAIAAAALALLSKENHPSSRCIEDSEAASTPRTKDRRGPPPSAKEARAALDAKVKDSRGPPPSAEEARAALHARGYQRHPKSIWALDSIDQPSGRGEGRKSNTSEKAEKSFRSKP